MILFLLTAVGIPPILANLFFPKNRYKTAVTAATTIDSKIVSQVKLKIKQQATNKAKIGIV